MGGGSQMTTMPAMMGIMMLPNMIKQMVAPGPWKMTGGMMGGMGGGMRSVPATGPLWTTVEPGQTQDLPTSCVLLSDPTRNNDALAVSPKGEKLQLGDIGQLTRDVRLQRALRRLAAEKAPLSVTQVVIWRLKGMDWAKLEQLSKGWVNAYELSLAKHLVEELDQGSEAVDKSKGMFAEESGVLYIEIDGNGAWADLSKEFASIFKERSILGLRVGNAIPERPAGPSLGARVKVDPKTLKATIKLVATDASASRFEEIGSTVLTLVEKDTAYDRAVKIADALSSGLLERLVKVKFALGKKVKGKPSYQIQIVNESPLILNGIALIGPTAKATRPPTTLAGVAIPPRHGVVLGASAEVVNDLGLKQGIKVVAVDLSGL
ncbi:MAG: hypothetical protein NVSMB14_09730 [Isosphaeraceae bacterium]